MLTTNGKRKSNESPIFEDIDLYRVIELKDGKAIMVFNDGGVGAIIPFGGINSTSFTEIDYERMFSSFTQAFNDSGDENTTVQIVTLKTTRFSTVDNESLPTYLQPRGKYLDDLADQNKVFVYENLFCIHIAPERKDDRDAAVDLLKRLIRGTEKHLRITQEEQFGTVGSRIKLLSETVNNLVHLFVDVNGGSFRLLEKKEDVYAILQKFTRPYRSLTDTIKIGEVETSPRKSLFSGVRARVNVRDFELDETYHKVYSLDRVPTGLIRGSSIDIVEAAPFEFIYSVSFRVMPHTEANNFFQRKLFEKRFAASGNDGAIVEDLGLEMEAQRTQEAYMQFVSGEKKGAIASVNLILRVRNDFIEREIRRRGESKEEIIRGYEQLLFKKVFPLFGGSEWVSEEETGWPVFCQCIPGFADVRKQTLKTLFISTHDLPYFLPIYENSSPLKHNGANHFIDDRGSVVVFDIMDPRLPAWNYSISGQTGSGKSVLCNTILTMQLVDTSKGKAPVICILDVGGDQGSYDKLIRLAKGLKITLGGVKKPQIQMFGIDTQQAVLTPNAIKAAAELIRQDHPNDADLEMKARTFYMKCLEKGFNNLNDFARGEFFKEIFGFEEDFMYREALTATPGRCEPSKKQMSLIMSIFNIILSSSIESGGQPDGFRNFDSDNVSELILGAFRTTDGRYPYMTDFYEIAKSKLEDGNSSVTKFLSKIRNWTREGAYPMFDMDTDVDLGNNFMVVDLKGLDAEKSLQIVYTLLFSQLFSDKMYYIRGRRKLMVRDECWSVLKNDAAREYFVEDLRTARKNGFATISLTQLPTDYLSPDPQAGRAILSNMQVDIFCKFQKENDIDNICREYNLSKEVASQIKELGTQSKVMPNGSIVKTHSKFMVVRGGKDIMVLNNYLHPFEYQLYSSSAEDNAVIDYYLNIKRKFKELEDTLWFIAEKKHLFDGELGEHMKKSGFNNLASAIEGSITQAKRSGG